MKHVVSFFTKIGEKITEIMKKHVIILAALFGTGVIIVGIWVYPLLQEKTLRVSFLDIGQGDAILITAPNGRTILIDAGPDQTVTSKVGEQLSFFDRTIDIVLATHSDADHIGGFPYLFDRYQIPLLIESEIASPTVVDRAFGQRVTTEQSDRLLARAGERIILDDKRGIVVDILFPDQNPKGWETNEASIVAKVSYGTTSFLLTGDAPTEVEDHLVAIYGDQLRSNVLKLGHHGSKTSSGDNFLQAVQPEIAIVSAGLGNKYGHPSPEVVERVGETSAHIMETMTMGTITCISDGKEVLCEGER